MDVKIINPFLESIKDVIEQMAEVTVELNSTTLKTSPKATRKIIIMVGVTGGLRGSVIMGLDERFAKRVVENMLMEGPIEELDEMAKSALCELGNVIMGTVGINFSSKDILIDITPPTLFMGDNITLSVQQMPLISVNFNSEFGEFDVDISVRTKE